MTEIIVESTVNETVIDIEGGPTLVATVDEVEQTIVTEFVDPVVIDLNSGPRGEPGAAIITGAYPPSVNTGVMGDMYIVTEGSVLVGQVFKKTTPYTWTDVGNVRGPAGGVNTVNGYTGPDVILAKADVGLGNVDNTSDAAKPVSTATQTALDLKADDSVVVKLTGNQTVAGIKTFSSAPVVPDASFAIAKVSGLQAALDLKAVDTTVVHLAGSETITGAKTFSATATFTNMVVNGSPSFNGGGSAFSIGAGSVDHGYISFFSRTATPSTRTAFLGVGSAASTTFTIQNEMTNGSINLTPNGTGQVTITTGNLVVSTGTITGNGSGLTTLNGSNVSSGTVADARLSTNVVLLNNAQSISGVKTFTTSPVVPTPTTATQAANKGYVDTSVNALIDAAPGTLDTLNELAAALGDDPNFATTMTNQIATKEPIIAAGTTAQYWRGDKTWQTLNPAAVGLGNVANLAQVDLVNAQTIGGIKTFSSAPVVPLNAFAIDKISGLQSALDLKAPLANPTFTGTVSGITKSMVGLANVDNTSDANKPVSSATQTALNLKADTSATVLLAGAQTITGAKTFSALITASAGVTVTGTVTATTFSGSGASLTNLPASALSTGTVPQARIVQNITRIEHGSTAGTARPTGATYVEWVGSASPTNMIAGDTWVNTGTNGNIPEMYPTGTVVASAQAGTTAPTGWYWCEGQEILISSDTALYNALTNNATTFPYGGNTNGAGASGSTHFRLPNLKGKVIAHVDGTTEFSGLGIVFGAKSVTLTAAQSGVPAHNHGVNDSGHTHTTTGRGSTWQANDPWGNSDVYFPVTAYGGYPSGAGSNVLLMGSGWYGTGNSTTGISIQNNTTQNASQSHNNIQPTMSMRYMVKR